MTPLQGSESTWTTATQGVALGCIVVPFQGDERSLPIITESSNSCAQQRAGDFDVKGCGTLVVPMHWGVDLPNAERPLQGRTSRAALTQASGTCGAFDLGFKNAPVGVENGSRTLGSSHSASGTLDDCESNGRAPTVWRTVATFSINPGLRHLRCLRSGPLRTPPLGAKAARGLWRVRVPSAAPWMMRVEWMCAHRLATVAPSERRGCNGRTKGTRILDQVGGS